MLMIQKVLEKFYERSQHIVAKATIETREKKERERAELREKDSQRAIFEYTHNSSLKNITRPWERVGTRKKEKKISNDYEERHLEPLLARAANDFPTFRQSISSASSHARPRRREKTHGGSARSRDAMRAPRTNANSPAPRPISKNIHLRVRETEREAEKPIIRGSAEREREKRKIVAVRWHRLFAFA